MTFYEIPLTPNAQSFYITLAGVQYRMALTWRSHDMGGWFLDAYTVAGTPVLLGVPLVTGVDLLAAYPDLNFGGALYVASDGDPYAVPTYANLGQQSHVYFAVLQ